MLSEALPCFQLLRMGPASPGDSPNRDLYTFRPSKPSCTYRLGRRAEVCDVTLVSEQNPALISRIHAEIHAERDADSTAGEWRVGLVDCSTHGTYVNAIRIPHGKRTDLNDGDLLTFGHPNPVPEGCALPPPHGDSEFYFLFQKVQVRPQDFAAITEPKAPGDFSCGFRPVLPSGNHRIRPLPRLSPTSFSCRSKATLILSSIGSLSKLKPQPFTFSLGRSRTAEPPTQPRASRNRRKSAHTLLPELEDEITRLEEEQPPPEKEQGIRSYVHCHNPLRLQQRVPERSRNLQEDVGPKLHITPSGKRRGRPRKNPPGGTCQVFSQTLSASEPCAAPRCHLPQDETVEWVQCDGCDAWFHVACVGCSYSAVQEADFRCAACRA
ncbi:PREDICTED: transcription factor 19 [Gekko japonicus]|uniref:Transcription factor 19 n=1 Tax=Gekko japonicus TaxID=146911 RepID=A0ABM1JRQ9_GEKJA|nr:PREDICTED: transcription factor 19 [Gekko japonicus]